MNKMATSNKINKINKVKNSNKANKTNKTNKTNKANKVIRRLKKKMNNSRHELKSVSQINEQKTKTKTKQQNNVHNKIHCFDLFKNLLCMYVHSNQVRSTCLAAKTSLKNLQNYTKILQISGGCRYSTHCPHERAI